MTTQPENAQEPATASVDLFECLKAAANDAILLYDIVENSDIASIADAFAALLAGGCSTAPNDSENNRNRPCPRISDAAFVDILLFTDRDTLDALQLVCRFLLEFIQGHEATEMPLRQISRVQIGEFCRVKSGNRWEGYKCRDDWLPIVELVRDSNIETGPCPKTVSQLVPYLRLAYCEYVCVDLRWKRYVHSQHYGDACGEIFDDLHVPNTFVNVLTVRVDDASASIVHRAFEAFTSLNQTVVYAAEGGATRVHEDFLMSAAERGVRSITFEWVMEHDPTRDINGLVVLPVLSFGFAEPTSGGDRSISNLIVYDYDKNARDRHLSEDYKLDFFAQLVKKARELDGRQHIDFTFTIDKLSHPVDPTGFEKYQKDKCTWLINDLENAITIEVEEAERVAKIHVFSSV